MTLSITPLLIYVNTTLLQQPQLNVVRKNVNHVKVASSDTTIVAMVGKNKYNTLKLQNLLSSVGFNLLGAGSNRDRGEIRLAKYKDKQTDGLEIWKFSWNLLMIRK